MVKIKTNIYIRILFLSFSYYFVSVTYILLSAETIESNQLMRLDDATLVQAFRLKCIKSMAKSIKLKSLEQVCSVHSFGEMILT